VERPASARRASPRPHLSKKITPRSSEQAPRNQSVPRNAQHRRELRLRWLFCAGCDSALTRPKATWARSPFIQNETGAPADELNRPAAVAYSEAQPVSRGVEAARDLRNCLLRGAPTRIPTILRLSSGGGDSLGACEPVATGIASADTARESPKSKIPEG